MGWGGGGWVEINEHPMSIFWVELTLVPGIGEDSSDGGEGSGIDTLCSDLNDKDNHKELKMKILLWKCLPRDSMSDLNIEDNHKQLVMNLLLVEM